MKSTCDRCGMAILPSDKDPIRFKAGYKPLGVDGPEWVELELCADCQHDLRNEFYRRGLTRRDDQDDVNGMTWGEWDPKIAAKYVRSAK